MTDIQKSKIQEIVSLHNEIAAGYLKMSLDKAIRIGELLTKALILQNKIAEVNIRMQREAGKVLAELEELFKGKALVSYSIPIGF